MPDVEVMFGGVGATQPRYERGLPCILVRVGGCIVVFDMGEGCQESFMKFGLGFNRPLYVFLTHGHGDHVLGVQPFLQSLELNGRERSVHIFAPLGTRDYVLPPRVGYGYPVYYTEIAGERGVVPLSECGVHVFYRRVPHTLFSYAYSLVTRGKVKLDSEKLERDGIPGFARKRMLDEGVVVVGDRERLLDVYVKARIPGVKVTYSGDTLPSPSLASLARESDVLIHEATLLEKDWERHAETPHSSPLAAAKTALLSRSKLLVLFHIGSRYADSSPLRDEAARVFPRVVVAEKGMSIFVRESCPRVFMFGYGFKRPF